MRTHLFLSHSNPEDNEFTLWLSLQLTALGYRVWCDLTRLLGGEDFWQDIEFAIRNRTTKFMYVLSRTSNSKPGPLQELQVATTVMRTMRLSNFIIPLLVDDLPHSETNIQLSRLTAIDFRDWTGGLRQLLEKLELDQVPKDPSAGPNAVAEWWVKEHFPDTLTSSPEEYLTNWYQATGIPDKVHVHTIKKVGIGLLSVTSPLPYPAIQHSQYLITFASAQDLEAALSPTIAIVSTQEFPTEALHTGGQIPTIQRQRDAQNILIRLLDSAWLSTVRSRNLPTYELSDGAPFLYFPLGFSEGDRVAFLGVDNRRAHRGLVGFRTRKSPSSDQPSRAYWHFGLRAKPLVTPFIGFAMRPHVVFSDDGHTPWSSKAALHAARRSWCKDWWNADWRDRILAAVEWLSQGKEFIELAVASGHSLIVAKRPLRVTSPFSYEDPSSSPDALGLFDLDTQDEADEFDDPPISDE
jgi:hypothetical protein